MEFVRKRRRLDNHIARDSRQRSSQHLKDSQERFDSYEAQRAPIRSEETGDDVIGNTFHIINQARATSSGNQASCHRYNEGMERPRSDNGAYEELKVVPQRNVFQVHSGPQPYESTGLRPTPYSYHYPMQVQSHILRNQNMVVGQGHMVLPSEPLTTRPLSTQTESMPNYIVTSQNTEIPLPVLSMASDARHISTEESISATPDVHRSDKHADTTSMSSRPPVTTPGRNVFKAPSYDHSWIQPIQTKARTRSPSRQSDASNHVQNKAQSSRRSSTPIASGENGRLPAREQRATSVTQFRKVIDIANSKGFEDIDSMISYCLTAPMKDTSVAYTEQRLGRNRRLPGMLAHIREHHKDWTQWEKRGFQAEMLHSAEHILTAECKEFSQQQCFNEVGNSDGHPRGNPTAKVDGDLSQKAMTMSAIRTIFQEELPNTWAIFINLAMDNSSPRRLDASNAVVTMMILLCCWGRLPRSQLEDLLRQGLREIPRNHPDRNTKP